MLLFFLFILFSMIINSTRFNFHINFTSIASNTICFSFIGKLVIHKNNDKIKLSLHCYFFTTKNRTIKPPPIRERSLSSPIALWGPTGYSLWHFNLHDRDRLPKKSVLATLDFRRLLDHGYPRIFASCKAIGRFYMNHRARQKLV